jgi:hypothetical protein
MAKKKRRSGLAGSPAQHAKRATGDIQHSKTLMSEALEAAQRGRCSDALQDFAHASIFYGRAAAHDEDGRQVSNIRDQQRRINDAAADVRDAIRACFKKGEK